MMLRTGRWPIAVTALPIILPGGCTDLASPPLQGYAIKALIKRDREKRIGRDSFRIN